MRRAGIMLAIVGLGCLLGACRHPAEAPTRTAPSPGPSLISPVPLFGEPGTPTATESTPYLPPSRAASPSRSASPSPTGFPEGYISYCNGRPSGEQVIAAVRRARANLPTGTGVSVQKQPVCAGLWQYTVLTVTGSEPLQVITKGEPSALTVVTVGTDPCTVEVRATAPPAFVGAVGC
ncbi:hypothetical protein AB0M46_23665 [Dactylosporangium sp. NPDC051485]|uniref:hypothetical protein n=1 Tax=Dactylosporangium sp. NPDC051485 TaxID=3154846 RepID=UPI00341B6F70